MSPEIAANLIRDIQEILNGDGYGIFAVDTSRSTTLWIGRIGTSPQFDEDDIYVMDVTP